MGAPSQLSPIQLIPSELLSLVFVHCVPPESTPPRKEDAPLLLGRVNRVWRAIANCSPRLWDTIHIQVDSEHPKVNAFAVSTWLRRSGSLPLQITILNHTGGDGDWDVNEALSLLAPHASRWFSLDCELYRPETQRVLAVPARFGGLPLLEQISLDCPPAPTSCIGDDIFDPPSLSLALCPKLSSVWFDSGATLAISKTDPTYALEEVTGCFNTSLQDCFHIIQNSPSLTVLNAECIDIAPFRCPENPFAHHLITELNLTLFSTDQGVNQFLDSITLPSLQMLELLVEDPGIKWSKSLPRFLQRSSPPLERLYIGGCTSLRMVKCLRHVPKLHELYSALDATDDILHLLTCHYAPLDPKAESDVAPSLEHLTLRCSDRTSASCLGEMVRSRWGGPSGRFPQKGKLSSVQIHLDIMSEEDLESAELGRCIEEGLDVTWDGDE